MQAQFLLGPAGSGKTFRCLAEVRAALAENPGSPPVIFLAPKQATFQIERQLLETGAVAGYTRLHILSFDRLAQFLLAELGIAPPKLVSAEGRLMVLRALLRRHEGELKLFARSAGRPGFAQELGKLLGELAEQQIGPAKLRALASKEELPGELRHKLSDLALLAGKYAGWLREHGLQDANALLDFATEALKNEFGIQNSEFRIEKLWLDGFAEMTAQELALLAAIIPRCGQATLAFCLETEPQKPASWLSIWSAIGKTFQRCRGQIAALPDCRVTTEILRREPGKSRFQSNPDLARLEESWTLANQNPESGIQNPESLRIVACSNPEAEATFAAREILKFVRAGNRFRDCAVLVRNLENYHQPLARVFRRYEIPFFLDRRESVAHHPLAELTRSALRTVAFDWRQEDWFAALKSGFAPVAETQIDELENGALEFGWRGKQWRAPLPDANAERLRQMLLPPFEKIFTALLRLEMKPDGAQLAEIVRQLWEELEVEATVESWTLAGEKSAIHATVWTQMNAWLDNVALAFPHEPLPLRDWLPVLEAGLGNLTVGVIPPALDEVLIGAVDRARNPDLKFVLVLGANESVFPAAPPAPAILTNADREELEQQNAGFGANIFDQISRERYLGYIACTRAAENLAVTFARQSAEGKALNPSPFIAQLRRIFPALKIEEFSAGQNWEDAEHDNELVPLLVASQNLPPLPALAPLAEKLARLREPAAGENLSPALAAKLYGPVLKTSVSRLEEFAACPFRFFVRAGLRANERKIFELDARERGNFQHEILKAFHGQLQAEGKRWRDVTPAQARERIRQIAESQMKDHRDGLFRDSAATAFAAHAMIAALQDFIEVIVGWMRSQYEFDPAAAEFGFGGKDDAAGAWKLDLGAGRQLALQGRIDRVDLWRDPAGDTLLAVVTDYKSGGKKLEPVLVANGVQLQLLAYLGALKHCPDTGKVFGAGKLVPAGAFYVSLRGKFEGGGSRAEILDDRDAKPLAYRHNGRFDADWLKQFDRRTDVAAGDQFNYRLKADGTLYKNSAEALPGNEFAKLLDMVEGLLRKLGEDIFAGQAGVLPFRKGGLTACDFCDYRAACRFDPWTQPFRDLRAENEEETT